jgi:endonuclease YncB( thermonuclease family)
MQEVYHQAKSSNFVFDKNLRSVQNNYKVIKGTLTLVGREPDGDSIAFIPNNVRHFDDIYRGFLLKVSSKDSAVQLRLEGIDSPELHYGSAFQPFGVDARNYFLELLGFKPTYKNKNSIDNPNTSVESSVPATYPAHICTNALEPHGRPISYLFKENKDIKDGIVMALDSSMLNESLNFQMLLSGNAYLLGYTSMPAEHFQLFKEAANSARKSNIGVWKNDTTSDFIISDRNSVNGLHAQLIYPKLFRRCIDFFRSDDVDFKEWLRKTDKENDMVRISKNVVVTLSSLVQQVNDHIYFQADTNDIIFVEK